MFTPQQKQAIAAAVQDALQQTGDAELPAGEISFILHVDGAKGWSWANIRNATKCDEPVPLSLICNLSLDYWRE
jgi:hypothetical protein